MKKLFSFISMFCMSMIVFAQGSLLATLSHDGNISAFYGASALKSAVAAAESGDVITLSSGQFSATNITKPITLRGAGMSISTDSLNAHEATIIQGSFTINIADSLEGRLAMEGLYFNNGITYSGILNNAQFLKCRFLNFIAGTNALSRNTSFIHCRIYDGYTQVSPQWLPMGSGCAVLIAANPHRCLLPGGSLVWLPRSHFWLAGGCRRRLNRV